MSAQRSIGERTTFAEARATMSRSWGKRSREARGFPGLAGGTRGHRRLRGRERPRARVTLAGIRARRAARARARELVARRVLARLEAAGLDGSLADRGLRDGDGPRAQDDRSRPLVGGPPAAHRL